MRFRMHLVNSDILFKFTCINLCINFTYYIEGKYVILDAECECVPTTLHILFLPTV